MCPDIVETKLLNQREREWKPDPQVINKWTVLYNLQKDYMERILPQIQATKKYDDIMHQRIIKEKAEKQNLANLIQFQNKINSDLSKEQRNLNTKLDSDKENCDDDQLTYQHNKVVAPSKLPHLSDFNKLILNEMKNKKGDRDTPEAGYSSILDPHNKNLLQESMKKFFNKKNGFNFKQNNLNSASLKDYKDREEREDINSGLNGFKIKKNSKINFPSQEINSESGIDANFVNEEMMDLNLNDEAVKSNLNYEKMMSDMKLENGDKIEYLGTSIGSPYSKFKTNTRNQKSKQATQVKHTIKEIKKEIGKPEITKAEFMHQTPMNRGVNKSKENIKKEESNKKELRFTEKSTASDKKSQISSNNKHTNKFDVKSEPVLEDSSEEKFDKTIQNPPPLSFIETSQSINYDKNLFSNLIAKSNFNLETQRRGRRRSRFPDPQWDCAEAQIAKLVRYLCEEEISASYQKYCKPIFEQINTMIESFLYHDNNLEICQNLHMCPVTVDI